MTIEKAKAAMDAAKDLDLDKLDHSVDCGQTFEAWPSDSQPCPGPCHYDHREDGRGSG